MAIALRTTMLMASVTTKTHVSVMTNVACATVPERFTMRMCRHPRGDCDCDGNQLDALEVCGGDCAADDDADGICDDEDDCVGARRLACATVLERFTSVAVPTFRGRLRLRWNQLDALEVWVVIALRTTMLMASVTTRPLCR